MNDEFFGFDRKAIRGVLTAEEPSVGRAVFIGECKIGAYSYIGAGTAVRNTIIGRYCSIATDVTISPPEHPSDWFSSHPFVFDRNVQFKDFPHFHRIAKPQVFGERRGVTIGNDVWIGRNVIVHKGVRIGDGAIIASGSVVSKNVLPYEIVGGIPAKHIRNRFDYETIVRFNKLMWWNYDLDHDLLASIDYSDVAASLSCIEGLVERGELRQFSPRVKVIRN